MREWHVPRHGQAPGRGGPGQPFLANADAGLARGPPTTARRSPDRIAVPTATALEMRGLRCRGADPRWDVRPQSQRGVGITGVGDERGRSRCDSGPCRAVGGLSMPGLSAWRGGGRGRADRFRSTRAGGGRDVRRSIPSGGCRRGGLLLPQLSSPGAPRMARRSPHAPGGAARSPLRPTLVMADVRRR